VEYSLLQRGVEREVLPAAAALGLGVLAWSPLGRGVLTGKYRSGTPADSRAASPHLAGFVEAYLDQHSRRVVEAVATAAEGLGVQPLEVALAWVRDTPAVTAAIVGARTAAQLRGVLTGEDLSLPDEIRAALDEVSAPALGYPERSG
jgi:aryl-alcohol dehydrogenase-like predicted oxidoreductase